MKARQYSLLHSGFEVKGNHVPVADEQVGGTLLCRCPFTATALCSSAGTGREGKHKAIQETNYNGRKGGGGGVKIIYLCQIKSNHKK